VDETTVQQVAVEARLVHRGERPEPHRDRRELPELGHAPGMRIAGQTVPGRLPAEVVELLLGEPTLEKGTCVDPGGRMALHEHLVAGATVGLAPEEVIEPDLVE